MTDHRAEALRKAVTDGPKKYYQRDGYGHFGAAIPTEWLLAEADRIQKGEDA